MQDGARTLHRLIYASRIAIPPGRLAAAMDAILAASERNNRLAGVTGLVLAHQGWFLQALEGPAEQVLDTYHRIAGDRRHSGAKVLSAGPAILREFADWNMCAGAIGPAAALPRPYDPSKLSGRCALTLLKSVRAAEPSALLRAVG